MTSSLDQFSAIDKLSDNRRRMLLILGISYLFWQVPQLHALEPLINSRTGLQGLLWACGFIPFCVSVIWLVRIQSQMKAASADTQAALDDELVKSNKIKATNFGYISVFLMAVVMMIGTDFINVSAGDVARLCVIVGVVVPVISFSILERMHG